jgi:hypothetical protein
MDAYRDQTARALTGCVGVYGTDWTDQAPPREQYAGIDDAELEACFEQLYDKNMAAFDQLPAATWTPEYKQAKREIQLDTIELHSVGAELARRFAERTDAMMLAFPELFAAGRDYRDAPDGH